jgi:glycosyltransferase involved in cell wall biosynthesis
MSAPPKVSVLIPTYNYARYLPEAIESVLAQDFGDFEIIIGDDASPDGSPGVLGRYAALDPRIRARVHPKNIGMVANWNWCLREARGEYCKFVFGDDCLVSPRALGRMAGMLDAAPGAVLAASARLILDEDSRAVEVWDDLQRTGLHSGTRVIADCLWKDRNLVGEPSAVLFRRAAATRGFDPDLRQVVDMEMWFHLLLGGDLAFEAEPLCGFRTHARQQTVANRGSHVGPTESLRIAARYLDVLRERGRIGSFARRYIGYRCLYYSRKRAPRLPEIEALEAALESRLTPGWRCLLRLLHRLTKPFSNLARACFPARGHRRPPSAPQAAAERLRWTPRS